MQKSILAITLALAGSAILASTAWAQQSQSTTPTKSAATPATGQAKTAPAAKSGSTTAKGDGAAGSSLATDKQKQSYALGMNIGKGLSMQGGADLDKDKVIQGLKDGLAGGKTLLTDDEMRAALTQLQNEMRTKQQAEQQVLGEKNMKEGADFLAANKTKEGVVALPSGLQYKILTAGTGTKPGPGDTVVCQYRGTLINGTEFDSSYKRGQPATFPVSGVIKGWTEALQLMPIGSKWQLFIPPDLAYGTRGAGAMIGPNTTLIFEVELLSIQGK